MVRKPVLLVVTLVAVLGAALAVLEKPRPTSPLEVRTSERRRPRPLRERFQEEFESAAMGESREGEAVESEGFAGWFHDQRSYPGDSIPTDALVRAIEIASVQNDETLDLGFTTGSGTWKSIGPGSIPDGQTDGTLGVLSPVSGRVSAIATHPWDPRIVFVGGAQGGVWKSVNANSATPTWTPLTDKYFSLAIGHIAIDPVNPKIIYVGTGEANRSCDSYYGAGVLRSLDGGKTWKRYAGGTGAPFNNPGPFMGKAIAKIVIDPATAGSATATTLWAATTSGAYYSGTGATCTSPSGLPFGLWRSKDSGVTWELQNVPATAVGGFSAHDIVLDPTNHETLYVAIRSTGVFKSTNAATGAPAVYTQLTNGFPAGSAAHPLRRLALAIGNTSAPGTLYAAVENGAGSALFGLYKTADGGANWSNVDAGFNGTASVTNANNLVTRVTGPSFVTDGTWTGRRFIVNGQRSMTISTVLSGDQLRLTAAYGGATSAAANWSTGNYPRYCDGQCFYDMTLAVDPTDSNKVFVGGNPRAFSPNLSGVPGSHYNWRSDDGGGSWRSVSQGDGASDSLHTDDHVWAFGPDGSVYDGNDGGIWRSADKGDSWTHMNTNLVITQFQGLSTHPTNKKIVIGGTQDNGTNILNAALQPAPKWFHADFGDGGQSLIDQSNPSTMFHTYFNQSFNFMGPARSDIGGAGGPGSWPFCGAYFGYQNYGDYYNGMNPQDPVSFYAPLAQHPGFAPNVVYFGSNRVYRSPNPQPTLLQIPSWTPVSPALTKGGSAYVSWIGVHPQVIGGKEVLYTGASDGAVAVSSNVDGTGVATWTRIDAAPLPNRAITGIQVLESDATGNTAYVTVSGFNGNTPTAPGHVFKTTTGLSGVANWVNISGNLPDVPVNAIIVDRVGTQEVLYIGTDIGVFRSRDGGKKWYIISRGLPVVTVFGLERNRTTGQIVAATHGRGMFELVKK